MLSSRLGASYVLKGLGVETRVETKRRQLSGPTNTMAGCELQVASRLQVDDVIRKSPKTEFTDRIPFESHFSSSGNPTAYSEAIEYNI